MNRRNAIQSDNNLQTQCLLLKLRSQTYLELAEVCATQNNQ